MCQYFLSLWYEKKNKEDDFILKVCNGIDAKDNPRCGFKSDEVGKIEARNEVNVDEISFYEDLEGTGFLLLGFQIFQYKQIPQN